MRFAFTSDQRDLHAAVRELLDARCPPAVVRAAWQNETGRAPEAWSALAEMGVLSALAPEATGGLGLTELDLVLILEETGRCALPEPIVETALVAAPLGAVSGTESAAVSHPESPFAPWADTARVVITLAADGVRALPIESCSLSPRASVDGARRLFAVDDSAGEQRAPIAPVGAAADAFYRGVLGSAAQLCGLADRMIEMTVEYCKQREQFGVAIGSFQAVKHQLADARIALEFARPLVYRGAYSLARRDPDRSTNVSTAKATAGDAALLASRVALQCHGAIGYTTEYDLHLFMKRAWSVAASWGDAAWHRNRIATTILKDDR